MKIAEIISCLDKQGEWVNRSLTRDRLLMMNKKLIKLLYVGLQHLIL